MLNYRGRNRPSLRVRSVRERQDLLSVHGEKLQSDPTAQLDVFCLVDQPHTTAAEYLKDAVVRDSLANQVSIQRDGRPTFQLGFWINYIDGLLQALLTGTINLYPRRGTVSTYLGLSTESPSACRNFFMAVWILWSYSTTVSLARAFCESPHV